MMINFDNFLNEEYKKLKISKLILDEVCQNFNLDINKLKFLSSGSYGNAYSIEDKVLKITIDIREINDVYSIINKNLQGIVKYYKISKVKNTKYYYAILMEKVITIPEFLKNKNTKYYSYYYEYTDQILYYILDYKNWNNINNYEEFIKLVTDFGLVYVEHKFEGWICHKIWKLYKKLKWLKNCPDIHINNVGFDKNEDLVFFDFNKISSNYRKVNF